jgi:hypothetical protein
MVGTLPLVVHRPILCKRNTSEKIVKKFLLAAAFTSVFSVGAIAQTSNQSIPLRDPPFGKGNADNGTMHLPSSAAIAQTSNQSIPPRDPPFGKGNADNDAMHLPSSAATAHSSDQIISPRDPPFGKAPL